VPRWGGKWTVAWYKRKRGSACDDAKGPLVELLKVGGNYQCLNCHRFPPIEAQAVRLQIRATNGDKLARVFEVRCYR
jgi:hypothetical protein